MKRKGISKRSNSISFILMIGPIIIVYMFAIIAMMKTFSLSLFEWSGLGEKTFVLFENFIRLFKDYRFIYSIRNIFIFIIITVVVQVGMGILLAFLVIDLEFKGKSFFKSIIFLPVVISNVAVSLYFVKFFDYRYGLLNYFLTHIGLEKVNLIGSGKYAIFFAVLPQTWQYIGLMFIIAYTGFSTVSKDFIDASKIDGFTSFQRLIYIYIPVSWSSLRVCFIIALVGPLKAFEHLWIITNRGAADQLSHVPATLMYHLGFSNYEYGYGSAISVFIVTLAIIFVVLFNKLTAKKNIEF